MRSCFAGRGATVLLAVLATPIGPWPAAASAAVVGGDYEAGVKPLLARRCCACHGALKQEGGLRLDTVASMRRGGESGAAIIPGAVAESLLLERVAAADPDSRMPPAHEGEPLDADEVNLLRGWIATGAPAPEDEQAEADPREHWAFRPRVRPDVPALAWGRNPVDAFVARAHATHGLVPQPEAPRHVLVRRLCIDLTGLPPTDRELAALEADTSPDWYEKLVDRLLDDPRHGERWARHWMDVWRYSDWWGLGQDHRNSQKHMWHWRDWIIESLNADLPYDEMLRQMLAADELYPDDESRLRATGYLGRTWFKYQRTRWLDETVEHVGKGMLGLTFNCARCHDHKYDPITQADFYRMRAFFEPYHMRLDMVAGETDFEKDGIPRAFDAVLDAPTYLFVRGDEKKPDTSRSLGPAVPAILAFKDPDIRPVPLPREAWKPVRRPGVIEALVAEHDRGVAAAEGALAAAVATRRAAEATLAGLRRPPAAAGAASGQPSAPAASDLLLDDFAELSPARWTPAGGDWRHGTSQVVQMQDGDVWAGLRLSPAVPLDFDASAEFTIMGGKAYRSVGLAFDSVGAVDPDVPGSPTDGAVLVYVSANDPAPKLQCAVRQGGGWQYVADGTVETPVTVDVSHTLRVAVRGPLVNVWLDGRLMLAWRVPIARRAGALQLVTYDAVAAFHRLEVGRLADGVALLDTPPRSGSPAVSGPPGLDAAESGLVAAVRAEATAAEGVLVARAAAESVRRRGAAMRAAWAAEEDATDPHRAAAALGAARAAASAEKAHAVARARQRVLAAEFAVAEAAVATKDPPEKELAAAVDGLAEAERALADAGESFTPLVGGARWSATTFVTVDVPDPEPPPQPASSGRRRALAGWITDADNPLTARVAANHVWMRHMGRPLVSSVFDFGRRGTPPDNQPLLDWLASELVDGPAGGRRWSMKHLHRVIVTSAAYRMSSSTAGGKGNLNADPENRHLWHRDPIRLESQAVRDCVLALAGTLDPAIGGPSVPAAEQAASTRRSIYFFHSSVDRNEFLTMFDEADVQDCYRRDQSIVPQQALALSNAALIQDAAATIAGRLRRPTAGDAAAAPPDAGLVTSAFTAVLGRSPSAAEVAACLESLAVWRAQAGAEAGGPDDPGPRHLVWALLNHNDFVTVR